jgi:hypothetical protein
VLRTLAPHDLALVVRLGQGLFALGLASSLGGIAADAMLLGNSGVRYLPLAIFLKPTAVLASTALYLRTTAGARPHRPFVVIVAAAAVAAVAAVSASIRGYDWAAAAFSCTVYATSALCLLHFHNVRGLLLDARAAKQVLPRALALLSLGSLTGGVLTLLVSRMQASTWGVIYAAVILITGWRLSAPFVHWQAPPLVAPRSAAPGAQNAGGWRSLVGHPLCRWILLASLLQVFIERSMEITAGRYLAQIGKPPAVASVLAWFTMIGGLGSMLFEALAVSPMVSHLGMAQAALVFPASALGLVVFIPFAGGLPAALAARACHTIMPTSLVDPVYSLVDGGLPAPLIRTLRTAKSGLVKPLTGMAFAVVIALLPKAWALPLAGVCAALLLYQVRELGQLYARSWLESLVDRSTGSKDLRAFTSLGWTAELARETRSNLASGGPREVRVALQVVELSPDAVFAEFLEDARGGQFPASVQMGLIRLADQRRLRVPEAWLALARGAPAAVRAEFYLWATGDDRCRALALAELSRTEGAGSIAKTTAAGAVLAGEPGNCVAWAILERSARTAAGPVARRAARAVSKILSGTNLRPEWRARACELTAALCQHNASSVRDLSIRLLENLSDLDRLERIARRDPAPQLRMAALDALFRLDPAHARRLAHDGLKDPSGRVRAGSARVLLAEGRAGVRKLRQMARDQRGHWARREEALVLLGRQAGGARLRAVVGRREARRALALHEQASRLGALVEKSGTSRLRLSTGLAMVRSLVEDQVVESCYLAVRCYADPMGEVFFDTVFNGLRHPDPQVRATALEALASHSRETIPHQLEMLVQSASYLGRPHIGSSPADASPSTASHRWDDGLVWLPGGVVSSRPPDHAGGPAVPTIDSGELVVQLHAWRSTGDAWLRTASAWALRDLESPGWSFAPGPLDPPFTSETLVWLASEEYPKTMPTFARMAFLKGMELFVGLGLEELAAVASVCRVESHPAGSVLFNRNDPPTHLCVVISGRVELRHGGAQPKTELAGSETIIGELGMFDDQPRPTTAVALEPVQLLTLSRADLNELLIQNPTLGVALLKHFSRKMRDLYEAKSGAL